VLLDALGEREQAKAGRAFVYQRNVERMSEGPAKLEDDLLRFLQGEIEATFPSLAPPAAPSPEA
jgi:hypothetical protein